MRSCTVRDTDSCSKWRACASHTAGDDDMFLYLSKHEDGVLVEDAGISLTPAKARNLGLALVQMADESEKENA